MPKMSRKKTRPRPCAVAECKNNDPYRTYHRIPTNPVMRQLWEAADVGLTNLAVAEPDQVRSWDRICSGHFTPWDFTLEQGEERNRRRLKSNAVPSIRECVQYVEVPPATEGSEATEVTDELTGVKIIKLDPGEVQTEDDTTEQGVTIAYHVEGTQVAKVEEIEGADRSQVTQVVTVSTGIEKIPSPAKAGGKGLKPGIKLPKGKEAKDLPPKDLKILELKARVKELEGEKKQWIEKEKAFAKKLEKAKEFTSKATQEKIIVAFLQRQGFTNAQVQVMSKGLKTAHIWGKEDIVEGLYQWKMGKQLYEYQQKKLWKMFPMPSLTAMKENTDRHQGNQVFECAHCKHNTFSQEQLDKHLKECARVKYRCDQCGQTFSAKPSLNRHIIVMHLKVEQHQCKLCHGMFAKGAILEEHIALSHLGFKTEKEWKKSRKENRELVQKYKEFIPFRIETVEYQEYQPVAIEGQVEEVTGDHVEVDPNGAMVHAVGVDPATDVHQEIVMAVDSIVPEGWTGPCTSSPTTQTTTTSRSYGNNLFVDSSGYNDGGANAEMSTMPLG